MLGFIIFKELQFTMVCLADYTLNLPEITTRKELNFFFESQEAKGLHACMIYLSICCMVWYSAFCVGNVAVRKWCITVSKGWQPLSVQVKLTGRKIISF
jgi:hypothetical protein